MKRIALVLVLLCTSSCYLFTAANAQAVIDCGKSALLAEASRVLPFVLGILTGGEPDWKAQLASLEANGVEAVACAVAKVAASKPPILTFANASESPDVTRASEYLVEKKWHVVNAK